MSAIGAVKFQLLLSHGISRLWKRIGVRGTHVVMMTSSNAVLQAGSTAL